jgi:hypothetical protein
MSRQYSPKQFFRKVSNHFLADYFGRKDVYFDLDLHSIYDHEVDLIFDAYRKLDDETRHKVETDFQQVNALASDGGIVALTEEAMEHENSNFTDTIKAIEGLHNKAMWAFLDSPDYWQAATSFFQVNGIASSSWKRINHLPELSDPFTDVDINLLSKAVGEYFFSKEGRGKRCKIEHYKRGKRDYFYAFPEDFAKTNVEWTSDSLVDLPHTLAFEIIFVYCQEQASLDMHAKKNSKNIPKLQQLFGQHILKSKISNFTPVIENKIYDLEPLVEADFEFVIPSEKEIFSVKIQQARSASRINPKSSITVTECPDRNRNAVSDKLAELQLKDRLITEVSIAVSFFPKPNRTKLVRSFTLSMPDKCNLGQFGDELLIREMLKASGIELQSVNQSLL